MAWSDSQKSRVVIVRRCVLPPPLNQDQIPLNNETRRYLCQVLRLSAGTRFIGFDGQGFERVFELTEKEGQYLAVGVEQVYLGKKGAPIGLIFAVPKGDKLDQVVRQITELGASSLYLYSAERSVGIWKTDKIKNKLTRIERVSREAARQSGRADTLSILPPQTLNVLLETHKDVPLKLYFDPEATTGWPCVPSKLESRQDDTHLEQSHILECIMCIGPEGGFSSTEIAMLKTSDWIGVKLQSPILRTENAAVVACAIALDRLGYLA